jgi:regulator of RNase E activity RraA
MNFNATALNGHQDMNAPTNPMEAIVARYRRFYTGLVYDILDEMGYPNQALATDLRPIRSDMIVAGPAFTIQMIADPVGDPELSDKRINLFKAMSYPCVDVRDCGFDTRVANYGEMNATLGRKYGSVGAIIDGGIRDTRHLLEMDFPTFGRYFSPVEAKHRVSYFRWQVPVTLRGAITASVTVHPGDFILGDIDGVLVIPKAIIGDVMTKAETLMAREDMAREEFKTADDCEVVYRKYGRL